MCDVKPVFNSFMWRRPIEYCLLCRRPFHFPCSPGPFVKNFILIWPILTTPVKIELPTRFFNIGVRKKRKKGFWIGSRIRRISLVNFRAGCGFSHIFSYNDSICFLNLLELARKWNYSNFMLNFSKKLFYLVEKL